MIIRKIICLAASVLCLCPVLTAQNVTTKTKAQYVCSLRPKEKGRSLQGMDIYKNYIVDCRNAGYANVSLFDGKSVRHLGDFALGSQHSDNHANVASFGRIFYKKGDPLPLIYISQAAKNKWNGYKDVLLVERIAPDFKSSELVQTIYFQDDNNDFGYALQWVLDPNGKYLYAYGNTTKDKDVEGNRHRIAKFRMPTLGDSINGVVTLRPADMLENYTIEDYGFKFSTIGQGLYVRNGKLYMPVGVGNEQYPAYLYVWNLKTRKMEVAADLNYSKMGEPEDMSYYKGYYYISATGGLFRIKP